MSDAFIPEEGVFLFFTAATTTEVLAGEGEIVPLIGQEAVPKWNVEIPAPVIDSLPSDLHRKPGRLILQVLNSRTKRVQVIEAPEMLDLLSRVFTRLSVNDYSATLRLALGQLESR